MAVSIFPLHSDEVRVVDPLADASSISAALIGQPSWYDYMGLTVGTPHTNAILGVINGVYAAGGAVGCVFNVSWSMTETWLGGRVAC